MVSHAEHRPPGRTTSSLGSRSEVNHANGQYTHTTRPGSCHERGHSSTVVAYHGERVLQGSVNNSRMNSSVTVAFKHEMWLGIYQLLCDRSDLTIILRDNVKSYYSVYLKC